MIFNKQNKCIATADVLPNENDLAEHGMFCKEIDNINISDLDYSIEDGKIIKPEITLSIDEIAKNAIASIDNFKNKKTNESIKYNGKKYQADKDSVIKMLVASSGISDENKAVSWYKEDNTAQVLTKTDLDAIIAIISKRNSDLCAYCRERKDDINSYLSSFKDKKISQEDTEQMIKSAVDTLETGYMH